MAIFFSQGGPTLDESPEKATICLTATFQITISKIAEFSTIINRKAVWPDCL